MRNSKKKYIYRDGLKNQCLIEHYLLYANTNQCNEKSIKRHQDADREFLKAIEDAQYTIEILYRKKVEYDRSYFVSFILDIFNKSKDKSISKMNEEVS